MITKQQYRKLMSEYQATGNVTNSAMKAGMSRRIARKYLQAGQPPQELQAKHTWRTREDPLEEIWPQAEGMLEEAPDLEAKALFEYLWERSPQQGEGALVLRGLQPSLGGEFAKGHGGGAPLASQEGEIQIRRVFHKRRLPGFDC